MNLHVVGGFLGSGKTTAIINALKTLLAEGRKVGVITNDKGRYMVDTAFLGIADVPTSEVPGGCFRCNYGDFQERIARLRIRGTGRERAGFGQVLIRRTPRQHTAPAAEHRGEMVREAVGEQVARMPQQFGIVGGGDAGTRADIVRGRGHAITALTPPRDLRFAARCSSGRGAS